MSYKIEQFKMETEQRSSCLDHIKDIENYKAKQSEPKNNLAAGMPGSVLNPKSEKMSDEFQSLLQHEKRLQELKLERRIEMRMERRREKMMDEELRDEKSKILDLDREFWQENFERVKNIFALKNAEKSSKIMIIIISIVSFVIYYKIEPSKIINTTSSIILLFILTLLFFINNKIKSITYKLKTLIPKKTITKHQNCELTWKELNPVEKSRIREAKVNFQGRILTFESFACNDEEIYEALSHNEIVTLLNGKQIKFNKINRKTLSFIL